MTEDQRMRQSFTCGLIALWIATTPLTANADYERPTPGVPDKDGVLWDTPVYDAVSGRYFALIWAHKNVYQGVTWETAAAEAKSRSYKGARGGLAVVDTIEVHEFLERTFHPSDWIWIGLRYACATRTLLWADGKVWKPGFSAWDANWKQDIYACSSGDQATDFMPIAYSPVEKGFRWIGKGRHKGYYGYFVEYAVVQP
jgi:hypothetical protein